MTRRKNVVKMDFEETNRQRVDHLTLTGGAANESLTVRDYFAAEAMHSFLITKVCRSESDVKAICADSYTIADAMLEARKCHD
jgi:hypothetical protein